MHLIGHLHILHSTFAKFYNSWENVATDRHSYVWKNSDFQTIHSQEAHMLWCRTIQIMWHDWIHLRHESIPGEWYRVHGSASDSNPCHTDNWQWGDHKFFVIHWTFQWLDKEKINCCETVTLNRMGMPEDLRWKTVKLRQDDIWVRTTGDVTAIQWMGKTDVCIIIFIIHQKKEISMMKRNTIKPDTGG